MVFSCGEFPSMRKYWDDVENVSEAIARWNEYKKETFNGVPSIGILVHTPGANRTGRLIKKYVAQMKDMQKTRGLARCICYQEKFGNQDVAFCHDYGKGGGRRGKSGKDKIVKKC